MASKITGVRLRHGERLRLESPGGGGHGNPRTRPPAQVAQDVLRGFVSPDSATRDYAVAVSADGTIDAAATAALRAGEAA
jgi:N-methylhydantoinase B